MIPTLADPALPSLPLYVIPADGLDSFLTDYPTHAGWLAATGFRPKLGAIQLLPGPDGVLAGAVAGFGAPRDRERQRFGLAAAIDKLPGGNWHLSGELSADQLFEASLGWLLACYRFDHYHPREESPERPLLRAPEGVDTRRLLAMAGGEYLTRDLINIPAEDMGPDQLEEAFLALAARYGAETGFIRGDDLLAGNFPLIHAVGRASTRSPRLLDLHWGKTGPLLTLVGKGVCFDTGGLDIKSAANMALMKKDMGGAANVMGLAQMIMALELPIRLRVLIPAVDNAIAGNAIRPGDILTSRKGLTIEVNNTDAEGRLVLADALALAAEESPDAIISMATLTGAARVAVGPDLAPFWAEDDNMAAALIDSAGPAFDPVWRLPFHAPYESMIEPGIADLDNAPGGGFAGAITAALFLRRFAAHPRYMHFDIYGHTPITAPARPKGGVGQGARALLNALPAMLGL